MKFTIQQIADRVSASKEAAYGFVTFLKAKGLATEIGKVARPSGQKGKGENLYEMDAALASKALGAMFSEG
jgi:hypothetical protein